MDIVLWILQALLAFVFLGAGAMKALAPEDKLRANPQMAWIERTGLQQARIAGAVEVLGALGLVLPGLTGIAPVLTPLAALGLAVTMALAAVQVHRPAGEPIVPNAVLGALALVVAIGRFIEPL